MLLPVECGYSPRANIGWRLPRKSLRMCLLILVREFRCFLTMLIF